MIEDSPSHRVFKIGELARLIAGELVLINQRSTVDLACVCWYLEEPVLSVLWKAQQSLCTLLETLPRDTWCYEHSESGRPVVSCLYFRSRNRTLNFRVILARGCAGTLARGLEQSPPLRVLDAPSLLGWITVAGPWERDLPQNGPQYARWRMVSSVEGFGLAYHGIQPSLHRPIPLPAFEEDFHFRALVVGLLRSSPQCPTNYLFDNLCAAGTHSSTTIRIRRLLRDTLGIFHRLALLRRSVLRTITYGVLLHDPIISCGDKPFDSPPQPP